MFLSKIEVRNFKSLENISIEPAKITVLIGPNSSGKSSILHILTVIKQSIAERGNQQRGQFTTRGTLVDLGSFADVVQNHDESKNIEFYLEGNSAVNEELDKVFGSGKAQFSYRCAIGSEDVELLEFVFKLGKLIINSSARKPYENSELQRTEVIFSKAPTKSNAKGHGGMLPTFIISEYPNDTQLEYNTFMKYFQDSKAFTEFFKHFHYIPTSRVIDEYSLPYVDFYTDYIIGSEGHRINLSRLLSYLLSNPKETHIISEWMKKLIGKGIQLKTVRTFQKKQEGPDVTIEFVRGNITSSIINEGAGPNQLILMLAILAITKNNSIIGIEEPEINLHPKGQSQLAKILLEIITKKNQQLILTTHSEHILYPLLTSVASKKENSLRKEDLSIYYFDIDENYLTTCKKLEIDDYGRIKGGLRGFFEEEINSLNEYLDAVKSEEPKGEK